MKTILLMAIVAIIVAAQNTELSSSDDTKKVLETGDVLAKGSAKSRDVNWKLLWLDDKRLISKVRVKIYHLGGFVDRPAVETEVESDDPLVLKNFTEGLTHGLHFTPRAGEGAAFGSLPFGELEVITNKDFFKIYFDQEFVLEEQHWRQDCAFFCWTLAKSIDDLLLSKAGRRLAPKQFMALSGEDWLKSERETYEKRIRRAE